MPRWRPSSVLLWGTVLAVLFFVLRSAEQTPDGLSYALAARDGVDVVHPHHLLHGPLTRLIHLALGSGDALLAGVIHNLLWLVALAWAAGRLASRLGWRSGGILLAAMALLCCRGVVFYATHVETYLPALACLALFAEAWLAPDRRLGRATVWLALAVLYHQSNVLVVVPALVAAGRPRRAAWGAVVAAGLVVWAAYVAGWRAAAGDEPFWSWLTTYARADVAAWGSLDHFGVAGLRDLGANQLRMVLPVPLAWSGPAAVATLAGVVVLAVHHLRRNDRQAERRFGVVFLAIYLPFFLWWIPSDPDFFLATLLSVWWLALLALDDLPGRWRGPWWGAAVGLLLAGNLVLVAWPLHRDPGPTAHAAFALDREAPSAATLVVGYGLQQELLYRTGRTLVFEGDMLARGQGANPLSGPGPVVVGRAYLELLLNRDDVADRRLLRALVGFRETGGGPVARSFSWLPSGGGVLVSGDPAPALPWPDLRADLADGLR